MKPAKPRIIKPYDTYINEKENFNVEWSTARPTKKFKIKIINYSNKTVVINETITEERKTIKNHSYKINAEKLENNQNYVIEIYTISTESHNEGTYSNKSSIVFKNKINKESFELSPSSNDSDEETLDLVDGDAEITGVELSEIILGYNLDILPNNKLEFKIRFLPFENFEIDRVFQTGVTEYSIKSERSVRINKWNYIDFGITDNQKLFIQIAYKDEEITDTPLSKSEKITESGFSIEDFLEQMINGPDKNVYEIYNKNNVDIKITPQITIDNFYNQFPQLMIGGIENKDRLTKIQKTTRDKDNLDVNLIKEFLSIDTINNGYNDFKLFSFRYFNKFLSQNEKSGVWKENDLQQTNLSVKDNCYIDLDFSEIEQEKINDKSGKGNDGLLIGDMGFNIQGDDYTVIDRSLPSLKIDNDNPIAEENK